MASSETSELTACPRRAHLLVNKFAGGVIIPLGPDRPLAIVDQAPQVSEDRCWRPCKAIDGSTSRPVGARIIAYLNAGAG